MADETPSSGNIFFSIAVCIAMGVVLGKSLHNIQDDVDGRQEEKEENKEEKEFSDSFALKELDETLPRDIYPLTEEDTDSGSENVFDNVEDDIMRTKTPISEVSRISTPVHVEYYEPDEHDKEYLVNLIISILKNDIKIDDVVNNLCKELDEHCEKDGIFIVFKKPTSGDVQVTEYRNNIVNKTYLYKTTTQLSNYVYIY